MAAQCSSGITEMHFRSTGLGFPLCSHAVPLNQNHFVLFIFFFLNPLSAANRKEASCLPARLSNVQSF